MIFLWLFRRPVQTAGGFVVLQRFFLMDGKKWMATSCSMEWVDDGEILHREQEC